jgi:hypothetical protein
MTQYQGKDWNLIILVKQNYSNVKSFAGEAQAYQQAGHEHHQ